MSDHLPCSCQCHDPRYAYQYKEIPCDACKDMRVPVLISHDSFRQIGVLIIMNDKGSIIGKTKDWSLEPGFRIKKKPDGSEEYELLEISLVHHKK